MPLSSQFKLSKYTRIEIIFFLIYFYVFPMLTDFEYNLWELHQVGIHAKDVEYNLLLGTSGMLSFLVFYKVLRYCLSRQKPWLFAGFILIFLIADHFYTKLVYLFYGNLDFLSAGFKKQVLKYYASNTLGYTFIFMIREFLCFGALAYYIHSDQQNQQLKLLKEQQLISELTYLKAQLQPHFFFNTLNNIYALALQQSAATAPLVAKLAEMMRYILYESECKLVSLQRESEFISNYVTVEQIRYRSAIQVSFDSQGIRKDTSISPLLLLPLVENAFKHGIQEETRSGFVQIILCQTETELTLEVNNSIASGVKHTGGIGLVNLEKRLKILYPERYRVVLKNDGKVYQAVLTLNLNDNHFERIT